MKSTAQKLSYAMIGGALKMLWRELDSSKDKLFTYSDLETQKSRQGDITCSKCFNFCGFTFENKHFLAGAYLFKVLSLIAEIILDAGI